MEIVLFLGLPVLLAVLIPQRWAGALLATFAVMWAVAYIDFSRVNAGIGDIFGMALLSMLMFGVFVILALRFGANWHKTQLNPSGADQRSVRAYLWALLALVSAVLLTAVVVQLCNALWSSAWLTHLVVAIFGLAWWMAPPLIWRDSSLLTVWSLAPANVVRCVGLFAIGAALAWSLHSGWRVVQAAEEAQQAQGAAWGRAYCLIAATEDGLQPASSVLELAGFSMQATRGATRHAQMATGSAQALVWHYWSYRKASFVPESMGGVLSCNLQANYAGRLPWLVSNLSPDSNHQNRESNDKQFWLAGGQWRIPSDYFGSASDKPARINFFAHGKNFGPPEGDLVRNGPQKWAQIEQTVSVSLCTPEKIHEWYKPSDAKHQVRTLDVAHGLARQETLISANQVPRIHYIEMDASGAPKTWIACDGPNASCHHAYMREGMRIQFMHAVTDLPDWKNLQNALWQRVRSFAVTWPQTAAQSCTRVPK